MEEDEPIVEEGKESPSEGTKKRRKLGRKQLLILTPILLLLLCGIGGGIYWWFDGFGNNAAQLANADGDEADVDAGMGGKNNPYVDVPPMIVNLRSPDGATRYLKVHFMLVPAKGVSTDRLNQRLPILIDAYQPFLRELRPEDLSGSGAVYRVKEELLVRAHQVLGPKQIKDILIQDLVQQ